MVRREIRTLLKKLAQAPFADIIPAAIKMVSAQVKTLKADQLGGYDSELTADLTSDDTAGEETL